MICVADKKAVKEFRLTYEGKTLVTVRPDREMTPGEAFMEAVMALYEYAARKEAMAASEE